MIRVCIVLLCAAMFAASCGGNIVNQESVSVPMIDEESMERTLPIVNSKENKNRNETEVVKQKENPPPAINEEKKLQVDSIEKSTPRVLKVGRETCIPCAAMTLRFKEMKPKLEGKAVFELIDIDKEPDAIQKYQLQSIPLIIFYDVNSNEIHRQTGVMEEHEVYDWLIKCGMEK